MNNSGAPSIALIIAVRNEEAELESALRSVCGLQYAPLNIVVVNDRSTDGTAAILARMQLSYPRLKVVTITQLPVGWLGKNNALYQGYLETTEDWLLFTDADVQYAPDALQKAMHYILQNKLDHLTALPQITSRSWLFRSVVNTFALMLNMKLRPWDISKPKSKASMGVGAFNLVNRTAYEKAGTHAAISMRPDDDLKLGERIKKAGCKQDVVYGQEMLSLQWYTSLGEFIKGLMKNTFSVSNYQLPLAISNALAAFVTVVLPIPLLLLSGYPFMTAALLIVLAQIIIMLFTKGIEAKWWHAILIPFAGMVMVYIILKSALLTLKQGGIYWRESFYSLSDLKKQA